LFLTSGSCPGAPSWYTWLYPLASLVAFITTAFLYTMFMLGMAEDNPSLWVKLVIVMIHIAIWAYSSFRSSVLTECWFLLTFLPICPRTKDKKGQEVWRTTKQWKILRTCKKYFN
jgi:hypothetical protein